ncbi:PilN domain-containing protein [Halomonas sp. YLGW01]|uniref:PilN domain-containing protein n=1 Tax=Halomonas sp. YLGW01 TaxID=2773308 RepID=UPI0017872654|nr:PilN domain-containing protein [Halomonas sp. YLGW01]
MGIEINLLPWRQEQREQRGKRFNMALGLMAVLGLGAGYAMTFYYDHQLAVQQQRNDHIRTALSKLERDIRTISEYEESRDALLAKIEVFTELQQGRPQTVYVFNELARRLQEGVQYTQLTRQAGQLRLGGRAEDNYQVSDQLRALEASAVFGVPVLSEVEGTEQDQRRFALSVAQHLPDEPPEDEQEEASP